MSRDPWADDWADDWTKAAKETKSSTEIWTQANALNSHAVPEIQEHVPAAAYKPQLKILRRENGELPDARDAKAAMSGNASGMDKASREARYKEARERLFGKAEQPSSPIISSRSSSPAQGVNMKPVRQSRGPEGAARTGFGQRDRQQTRETPTHKNL